MKKTTKGGTKKPRERGKANRLPLIEKALGKRTKAELIEIVMKVAKDMQKADRVGFICEHELADLRNRP